MSTTLQCELHNLSIRDTIFSSLHFEGQMERPNQHGGYADVYCVTLSSIDPPRKIAVKCFRKRGETKSLQENIANELKIWKILNHNHNPNVAPLLGLIESADYDRFGAYFPPFPVCEYYHNKDLDTFVNIHTPNPSKRFQLLKGVARGLNHIHKLLVVHGDLKASNVLVDNAGDVTKVCDFGSARINCSCYRSVENQNGTVPWDSPELIDDDRRTSMSDIWAFGCLALEAQFGEPPYHANHVIASKKMMYNEPPATGESFDLGDPVSKAVWDMMQKCWEFEPRNRPAAEAVLLAFDRLEVE